MEDVDSESPRTHKPKTTPDGVQLQDVKDHFWRWPTHEKWYSHLKGVWETKETTGEKAKEKLRDGIQCPFEVTTVITERDRDPEVTVRVRSPYLASILWECLPHMMDDLCCEEPEIDAKDLFVIWPALQQELKKLDHSSVNDAAPGDGADSVESERVSNEESESESVSCEANAGKEDCNINYLHLHHLLRFLSEHFKDTLAKATRVKQEGVVSYKMLWAFLNPPLSVRYLCKLSGEPCHGIIHSKGKYKQYEWAPDKNHFKIRLKVMDYNGESYRKCTMKYEILEFDDELPFTSVAVCPWSFYPEREKKDMQDILRERGKLFYSCVMEKPFRFMHCQGSLSYYERNLEGCLQSRRVNADGRVMVDLLSVARVNPEWPMGNAQPPSKLLREMERMDVEKKKPSEGELMWAPAVAYGFSFSLKKWGCFDLQGLKDIRFNDEAYEQLVMKSAKQKEMLRAIVAAHLRAEGKGRGVDMVANKGNGCVVLCYGPPGTGKTLTAESLAESLHRPLWAISAFELGEEAGVLEMQLRQVLSTAVRWRAVVLLDEADGYLERRSTSADIKRNLMAGVFLRLLEYYEGVLFLTTNRVHVFDEAFLSRICLCIRYPPLDDKQRSLIWQTLLRRAGVRVDASTQATVMAFLQCGPALNGREIRNIISLATTWAESGLQPLRLSHVQDALELVISGCKELLHQDLGFTCRMTE